MVSTARETDRVRPFLKWAGGKRSLLPHLLPLVPARIDTYYEPFLGGGALFFELARTDRFRQAVLSDRNEELVQCYLAIQANVSRVITALDRHQYDEESYYRIRDQNPARLSDADRAARTIFLNLTGFNGLFRVNQAGRFNVPYGGHTRARLVNTERLSLAAKALDKARVKLKTADFEEVVADAGKEDFVYFDPPYVPLSATASFTAYARAGFSDDDQARLANLLHRLGKDQIKAVLSNSDCPTTRRLYRGLRPRAVDVRRAINSVATKRGPVSELIVRSYAYRAKR